MAMFEMFVQSDEQNSHEFPKNNERNPLKKASKIRNLYSTCHKKIKFLPKYGFFLAELLYLLCKKEAVFSLGFNSKNGISPILSC